MKTWLEDSVATERHFGNGTTDSLPQLVQQWTPSWRVSLTATSLHLNLESTTSFQVNSSALLETSLSNTFSTSFTFSMCLCCSGSDGQGIPSSLLGPNKWEVLLMNSLPQLGRLVELILTVSMSSASAVHFFTELGTSCPKMKILKLGSRSNQYPFHAKHQLALVLGGKKCILPKHLLEKFERGDYSGISFDSKTPICNSLEVFSIWSQTSSTKGHASSSTRKMSITTNMFILRHFVNLSKLAIRFDGGNKQIFRGAAAEAVKELFYDPMFNQPSKEREATGLINDQEMSVKWTRFYNKKTPCKDLNIFQSLLNFNI